MESQLQKPLNSGIILKTFTHVRVLFCKLFSYNSIKTYVVGTVLKKPSHHISSRPPPCESQLAFHIYYVKYENTLTCKRISWDRGGLVF